MLQTPLLAASLPGRKPVSKCRFSFAKGQSAGIPSFSKQGQRAKGASPASLKLLPYRQLSPGFGLAKQNRPAMEPVRLLAGWASC